MNPLIFSIIFGAIIFVLLGLELVFMLTYRKRYVWNYRGKEIVLQTKAGHAALYLGGQLSDEISGRVNSCILKAFFEGEEILVKVRFSFSPKAEATAGGALLTPVYVGK